MKRKEYVVYSIRIPKELRDLMKMVDVDWGEEIREFIYRRVKMEYRRKLLKMANELHKKFGDVDTPPAWVLIREDREKI